MGYKATYNGYELDQYMGILKVHRTILPPRTNHSRKIPSMFGEKYSGYTYGIKTIELDCYIKASSYSDHMEQIRIIGDILNVDAPKKLVISDEEDKFCYAVLDGDISIERVRYHGTFTLTFVCHDPFTYAIEPKQFIADEKNIVTVENSGSVVTQPTVLVSFHNNANFLQVTNYTGETVLIGNRPTTSTNAVTNNRVIYDQCATMSNWTVSGNVLDSGREVMGSAKINAGGYAIIPNDFGTSDRGWHGSAYRRNIGQNIKDFKVEICMEHDSRGDYNKTGATSLAPPNSTSYVITSKSGTIMRNGRGTTYSALISIPYNTRIHVTEISGGWAKTTYLSHTGYVNLSHCILYDNWLKQQGGSSTSGGGGSTGGGSSSLGTFKATGDVYVRSAPANSGKALTVAKKGVTSKVTENKNGWYKVTVNGKTGYSYSKYWTKIANTRSVSTLADDTDTYSAENKMGKVEAYGFDRNGKKLFKFSLSDDEKYVEYTKPQIQIGNEIILEDTNLVPAIKTQTVTNSDGTKTTTKIDSGRFGAWNESRAWFKISRETNSKGQQVWVCSVEKVENGKVVKTLQSKSLINSAYPTEDLNHIVIWFGQYKNEPVTDLLSVKHLNVFNNTKATVDVNFPTFRNGDELKIDFEKQMVYLNDSDFMTKVDIGSQFFNNPVGDSQFVCATDDANVEIFSVIQEKWL